MASATKKYDVFQAIAAPTRREVLRLLTEKELSISKITSQFPMSRTAISKHLHILSDAKIVSGRKVGREKLYRLQPESLTGGGKQWLPYFEQFWDNKLSILKHVVENEVENEVNVIKTEFDKQ